MRQFFPFSHLVHRALTTALTGPLASQRVLDRADFFVAAPRIQQEHQRSVRGNRPPPVIAEP